MPAVYAFTINYTCVQYFLLLELLLRFPGVASFGEKQALERSNLLRPARCKRPDASYESLYLIFCFIFPHSPQFCPPSKTGCSLNLPRILVRCSPNQALVDCQQGTSLIVFITSLVKMTQFRVYSTDV